jgi:hypothetical protein
MVCLGGRYTAEIVMCPKGPSRAMLEAWRYSWLWELRRLCLIEFLIIMADPPRADPDEWNHGFRTHSLTEKASFTLLNNILTAMNNKLKVRGIFCDLQKAFDCVNHEILLKKYYLTGRFHRVVLDYRIGSNNSSTWERIKCGVPKGSILGPLLFYFILMIYLK